MEEELRWDLDLLRTELGPFGYVVGIIRELMEKYPWPGLDHVLLYPQSPCMITRAKAVMLLA